MGEIGTRWWRRATGAAVGAVVGTVALVLAAPAAGATGNSFTLVSGASAPGSTLNATSAVSATDVWAGGAFRPTGAAYDDAGLDAWLEHFDGGSWTATAIPGVRHFDETVNGVAALSHGDVWAVGTRKKIGFKSPVTTLTYHFNGTSWSEVATPTINANRYWFSAVSGAASSDVWAVGQAASAPSTALNALAEHWNGSAWSIVPVPLPAGTTTSALLGVHARAANDVWAVGTANGHTFTVHWNGSAWSVIASRDVSPQRSGASVSDSLTSVRVVAADNVWAVGQAIDTVNGSFLPYRTVVEHFDGTAWTLVSSAPSPTGHPSLTGVSAASASDVWAVGSGWTDQAVGTPVARPIFLHFNGTAWASVTPPANVGGGDNLLNGVTTLPTGDTWAVGSSPLGALIERRV